MHELGIAQSVVDYALSEAERRKAKGVKELQLSVGELMQVDTRALSSALGVLMTGSRLHGCKVKIVVEKAAFVCGRCAATWRMKEALAQMKETPNSLLVKEPDGKEVPLHFLPSLYQSFLHCPKCGSADIATSGGEGIRLKEIVFS
jgi:hydrogenase nickel insertion protein HypA